MRSVYNSIVNAEGKHYITIFTVAKPENSFNSPGTFANVLAMLDEWAKASSTDIDSEYDKGAGLALAKAINQGLKRKGVSAEFERIMLMQRFASGKIAWAGKGYGIGGHVPFGYTKEYDNSGSRRRTKLVPVPAEQEVLKFIKAAREQGLGARRIATQIQNRFPGFEDFPYHKVHRIIKRKFQGLHE